MVPVDQGRQSLRRPDDAVEGQGRPLLDVQLAGAGDLDC